MDAFYDEGFIIVRNLIDGDLLQRARVSTLRSDSFRGEYETLAMNAWDQDPVFLELGLHSQIAQAVAQLTPAVASGEVLGVDALKHKYTPRAYTPTHPQTSTHIHAHAHTQTHTVCLSGHSRIYT